MLYIDHMSKISLLESFQCGHQGYSLKADLKFNAWALVALLFAQAAPWLLHRYPEWPSALQSMVTLSPLVPSLLYARSIWRWNHSDELQRRIQVESALFATTGSLFFATALSLLSGIGALQSTSLEHGLGFIKMFAVVGVLYVFRIIVLSRRYR